MTSQVGSSIIINGWKAAGIYDALEAGATGLPSIDPFDDISPLTSTCDSTANSCEINGLTDELRESFVNDIDDEENSEWEQSDDDEDNVDFQRNAFDIILDDE
jgi:hypothetical protein